jgi:hypothetical protein
VDEEMSNQNIPSHNLSVRLNWSMFLYRYIFGLFVIYFVGILIFLKVTYPALQNPHAPMSGNFNWLALLIFQSVGLGLMPFLLFWYYPIQALTIFTSEGFKQFGIHGWRFIPWNKITHAETLTGPRTGGKVLLLRAQNIKLRIELYLFTDEELLLKEIKKHIHVPIQER